MNKEQQPIKTEAVQEKQETKEVPQDLESPEELRQKMTAESESEVDNFKKEGQDGLASFEDRAGKEGLAIDSADKEALQGLDKEAGIAQRELAAEIKPFPEKANIIGVTKDTNFEGSLIVKTEDEEGRITGYAIRKDDRGNWGGNEIRYMKDSSMGPVYQLHESDFAKLRQEGILDAYENIPEMKEREIENPELLDKKEASKKFLAEERAKLAQELWNERKAQRKKLEAIHAGIRGALVASESMDSQQESAQYEKIADVQSGEANELANRLESPLGTSEQDAQEERENISHLITNSKGIAELKAKLQEHYAKADELAKEKFESIQKTVEQTLLRNNAFIVHTFLVDEKLRHNENSNISGRATIEDDIDTLLSLEPSISTSSVVPGSRQGLWGERVGVVLGGGDVRGAVQKDNGTVTGGIKYRTGNISSSQEIDAVVSDKKERGYNELVVNNPKVFGFFQNVSIDESGKMKGFSYNKKYDSIEDKRRKKEDFMNFINLAIQKGMPPLVMTPDRRLFEFMSIDDDGVLSVGSEITPEQVATGKAGLPDEKRRELGEEILSKNLFKNIEDQKEAKGLVAELSGQENTGVELSREEYLAYARDTQGKFYGFPKHLLEDKEFMSEAAQFGPVSAYEKAGVNLKRDTEFIKHIYSLRKENESISIYSSMPDDLKKNESIALLAIENDDYKTLESELADSPVIWEKIVDKLIEKNDPDKWFSRGVGEDQIPGLYFSMTKGFDFVNMTERLMEDPEFIPKLNRKYPNYEFSNYHGQLSVKKLV
jgi:hypothetical protein